MTGLEPATTGITKQPDAHDGVISDQHTRRSGAVSSGSGRLSEAVCGAAVGQVCPTLAPHHDASEQQRYRPRVQGGDGHRWARRAVPRGAGWPLRVRYFDATSASPAGGHPASASGWTPGGGPRQVVRNDDVPSIADGRRAGPTARYVSTFTIFLMTLSAWRRSRASPSPTSTSPLCRRGGAGLRR